MQVVRTFKTIGTWCVGIAVVLGLSYCSEMPKYRFERVAAEAGKSIPGARLIGSFKSGDLVSPVSWFWPATTTWNFAWPDPIIDDRFYTLTLVYGEKEPIVFLLDADCKERKEHIYALDEPETALPARDLFGEPVVAPNGKTYRQFDTKQELPQGEMHQFCDTNWRVEKTAAGNAQFGSGGTK